MTQLRRRKKTRMERRGKRERLRRRVESRRGRIPGTPERGKRRVYG